MFVLIRMWWDRRRREAVLKMAGYRIEDHGWFRLIHPDGQCCMVNASRLNLVWYGYERFIGGVK